MGLYKDQGLLAQFLERDAFEAVFGETVVRMGVGGGGSRRALYRRTGCLPCQCGAKRKKVLLLFFDASNDESLGFCSLLEEVNRELSEGYKVAKVDTATKKNLARKYNVEVVPSALLLDRGRESKRLDCA